MMQPRQRQNRTNGDRSFQRRVPRGDPFGRVGKPLSTSFLAGVPVHVVAARLGHADPAVTLRVYAHVLREHTAGVGDIFAQAVTGTR